VKWILKLGLILLGSGCSALINPIFPTVAFPVELKLRFASSLGMRPSIDAIQTLTSNFTVQIIHPDSKGSGVILHQRDRTYLVLTNAHVISQPGSYQIRTPDGIKHSAIVLPQPQFKPQDLALLQFISDRPYSVALLNRNQPVKAGDPVYGLGFPIEPKNANPQGLQFSSGILTIRLTTALEDGYQLGYTNAVEKGMSGGPLVNEWGELVGLQGQGKTLWEVEFKDSNGKRPCAPMQTLINHSNWAIPIETIANLLPTIVPPIAPSPISRIELTPAVAEPSLDSLVLIQQAEAARQCRPFQETRVPPIAFPRIPMPPR
jgi:S1-C subfamily serine protease